MPILTRIDKANTVLPCVLPILTYVHEPWVMTDKLLPKVQAAETGVLRIINGAILREKVRSCEIRKALNVERLFLRIEKPSYVG